MTRQEVKFWVQLRELRTQGFHFRRQVPIDHFVVDFACLKSRVIVEVDGGQHGLDRNIVQDRARDAALKALGFEVMRFWNVDIDRSLAGVMEALLARLSEKKVPTPDAPRRTLPCGEG